MVPYTEIWKEREKENSDLRIIANNTLISVPFEYLDAFILKKLKEYEPIKFHTLVARCIGEGVGNFHMDNIFNERINDLIKRNQIEICEKKLEIDHYDETKEIIYIQTKK